MKIILKNKFLILLMTVILYNGSIDALAASSVKSNLSIEEMEEKAKEFYGL